MTQALRAPFVWTPDQPIDPEGARRSYLGERARPNEKNRWFLFRKRLLLEAPPRRAPFSITVDGRYILFVNGRRIGRGPVRCSPLFQRYDEYDLAGALGRGENVLAVLVHTYGRDTAFYETVKGMWQPTFGDGGLWTEGEAETAAGRTSLSTATGWLCLESDAWTRETPQSNHSLGFIEDFDAERLAKDWMRPDCDDRAWAEARPLLSGGGGPEAAYGGMETKPFPILLPRIISQLEERMVAARRVVWARAAIPSPDLPIHRRIYEERLEDLPDGAIERIEDLLKLEGGSCAIRTAPGRDVSVLLDFGKIMTGRPWFAIEARGGEVVEIACVEGLADEWAPGGPGPESRPGRNPWLGHDAHVCRYRARNGVQTFERFEWCAIRWMQVTVRDAPQGLLFRGLGANLANYPARTLGRFSSSDPMLDRLWSLGAYTLRQCMHDSWEDCPSREQRQWLGDVAVENLVGWAAFGPQVAPLTANFLLQAAESQRPDGLTQMFAPGDHRINGLLIPDWTLQWILVAGDHYDHSGDLATIRTIFPSILKALAWFEPLIAPSGLAADIPYWRFIDWAGLGREGEASAINAELAGAFRVASRLAGALGWPSEAERLAARSEVIGAAIQRRCWDERRGVFVDVVDPVTGERQVRVSQHANAAIALWTQAPPERIARALDRISQSERLVFTAAPPIAPTGETLDPQEDVVLANTFFSHFVYLALARHGRWADAVKLMRERFGPMLERGATTLWESFAPTASLCHGFSATPTYQLSRHVLGVRPDSPGFSRLSFGPDLADLSHAEGVVPVSAGDVEVHVEMDGERMVGRCRHPKEVEVRVDPAPGWTIVSQSAPSVGGIEAMFERTL